MNSTDAMTIINAICDKIGIVYDKALGLVPYIVKYNVARDTADLIIFLLVTGFGVWLAYKAVKTAKEERLADDNRYTLKWYLEDHLGLFIPGACIAAFGVIVVFFDISSLIQWLIAPEISALKWALELVK